MSLVEQTLLLGRLLAPNHTLPFLILNLNELFSSYYLISELVCLYPFIFVPTQDLANPQPF